ncbi:Fanconi anemia group D2 protein-like [Quillaja saponaria]|uniref:Fanconi anemia group D2 protein-like n=1 Tax=Quillaja saponaria TaxID=32244 RepID=A0AAD7PRP4_QUISA|nr:Fanconi anemia group D2 protein-like [Quillaja saponaria]
MVFLHQQIPSRKRPSSSSSSFPPSKITKSTTANSPPQNDVGENQAIDKTVSVLADAGCTLLNPSGPPCLPSDPHKLRRHLQRLFSSSENASSLRSDFLSGFSSYIQSPKNLRRVLIPSNRNGFGPTRSESLVRQLLLVPSIQQDLQLLLLEKLPEYFDIYAENNGVSMSLEDDTARLIINQLRWLDFIVDTSSFTDKLMQVLSICPPKLKREIIESLPEIIGDLNNKDVIDSLEQMLQEDSTVIMPVLESLSNLNLDSQLQEKVTMIALSCIRTIDAEHMPCLLRYLLLSSNPECIRRIITQIRKHLKFVGASNSFVTQSKKFKGKSPVDNSEASILNVLSSCLKIRNILCQEILKELECLKNPQDHRVIDIWLLILVHLNSESLQKSCGKIIKKKIIEDCIQKDMFDQCIHAKELVKDHFRSFLSLSEYLLACKEEKTRDFGLHLYISLFEELADTYSRQEVLGSLVTHVGSGVSSEVRSALQTMGLLASKYAKELISFSPFINGILDYLEGFSVENLHKVYEVFSHLALSAQSYPDSCGSSIANELLMIVRKQVSHPDMKYKQMGLIGTLKIVSCIGDANDVNCSYQSQKSNSEEALELLRTSLDSSKLLPLPLILFYDELSVMLDHKTLHPVIMEWIGKHVGEFESIFLSDLEAGHLHSNDSYCGLEGELWMNLDGDISPVCLSILPLASSSMESSSLQVLPAKFLLLSTIERSTNHGSLGGIDALLGCPLHLPSSKYFSEAGWKSLTQKQKQIVCLSLYYAANWIRELLNAFCTQLVGNLTSQATKEEIISKLMNRLRNLVFLESLLDNFMKSCSLSIPELHFYMEHCRSTLSNQPHIVGHVLRKNRHEITHDSTSPKKMAHKRNSKASKSSNTDTKLQQPTILDMLKKAGIATSQELPGGDPSGPSTKGTTNESGDQSPLDSSNPFTVEISAVPKDLEAQRFNFRPLLVQCYFILTFPKSQESCCSDPTAELPLYLYLLRDIQSKLKYLTLGKHLSGFIRMTGVEFIIRIRPLFTSLERHLNAAVSALREGNEICSEHWKVQSAFAGNPDIPYLLLTKSSVSIAVIKEILHCLGKMLNLPDIVTDKSVLSDLLEAFQSTNTPDVSSGINANIEPGTLEYLLLGAFLFVEDILEIACSYSFMVAAESLLTLESIITSAKKSLHMSLEGNGKGKNSELFQGFIQSLCSRLRNSSQRLLRNTWDDLEGGRKCRGETIQKILHIYLENSDSTSDSLEQLACSILPQVSLGKTTEEGGAHGFPTLRSTTLTVWYRELHEVNLTILYKLIKEVVIMKKSKGGIQHRTVEDVLVDLRQSVNVVVSLVNMCRTHDKAAVHGMAIKYGGRFVDCFLKAFDFLQANFQTHNQLIINLVKQLQMATRTIQTLCSEAKGMKRTNITSKIPSTKRSMERFLFHVKALLYTTPSGCTFWMGNLKHKDLSGEVVSSQAYVDVDENPAADEDEAAAVASEEDGPAKVICTKLQSSKSKLQS